MRLHSCGVAGGARGPLSVGLSRDLDQARVCVAASRPATPATPGSPPGAELVAPNLRPVGETRPGGLSAGGVCALGEGVSANGVVSAAA
eukprot:6621818-Pyramimonas_sp.AAC.1